MALDPGQGLAGGHGSDDAGWLRLSQEQLEMDEALAAIYASESEQEIARSEWESPTDGRPHGAVKGRSLPRVARWLDQIRNFFPKDVVVLLQQDAIERRGMKELLFEPEVMAKVEPSIDLASAVLELKNLVPEKAKNAARDLVRRVVEELRKRLESKFAQAIRGSLDRSQHSPFRSLPNLDWPRTIRRNLKNYNETLKTIVPEEISFFRRRHRQNEWNVIIAMDQSGSMATSLIYGGIMGAILASMPAVETHVVAFNHEEVVDLTELCTDPVNLLFGVQLGGAEDYWKATCYCEQLHAHARQDAVRLARRPLRHEPERKAVREEDGVSARERLAQSHFWPFPITGNHRSTPTLPVGYRSSGCRVSAAPPTAFLTCWPPCSKVKTCSNLPTTFG